MGFESKWKEWQGCLADDADRNSVSMQVKSMMWRACAFRTINDARGLAVEAKDGGLQLNALLHGLLDESFIASQLIDIRRLSEDNWKIDGPKGVRSLGVLLKDLEQHVDLLTRSNLCKALGVPVDMTALYREIHDQTIEKLREGRKVFAGGGRFPYAEGTHGIIDEFCGVDASSRRPQDRVDSELFRNMRKRLRNDCLQATTWADKFLAHAATPASRETVVIKAIDLGELWRAQETIARIYSVLEHLFGGAAAPCVPIVAYDIGRWAEQPLVNRQDLPRFRSAWERWSETARDWNNDSLDWMRSIAP